MTTETLLPIGTPVKHGMRLGVVVSHGDAGGYLIATSKGVEAWGEVTPTEETDKHRAYMAKHVAREADLARAAAKTLTDHRTFEAKKKDDIQKMVHSEGKRRGLNTWLDPLLTSHGMVPTPLTITRVYGMQVRWDLHNEAYRFGGTSTPLDRLNGWGYRVPIDASITRLNSVSIPMKNPPFLTLEECNCDDPPVEMSTSDEDLIQAITRNIGYTDNWTPTILKKRLLYVSNGDTGQYCKHREEGTGYRSVASAFKEETSEPDAAVLANGDYIRVTEDHWSMDTSYILRVTDSRIREATGGEEYVRGYLMHRAGGRRTSTTNWKVALVHSTKVAFANLTPEERANIRRSERDFGLVPTTDSMEPEPF